jgi:RNA polymerase sigma factor (sigma-70 family)
MNDAVDPDLLLAEGRALRALARCLVGEADADDIVHDAQLALLRTRGTARQAGPWLAGTVRKLAAMLRRGDARRRRRELAVARDVVDAAADPAAIAAQAEVVRRVAVAVHALEEPIRTVVLLRFWHGLLPEVIAARLGVPRNTVRSRLQRGLARLRERLDAGGGRAQWAAPLGAFVGVREGAVGTAAVSGLVLAGAMMKTKVLAAVGFVLAAVLVMPAVWPGGGAAQHADAGAANGPAAVVVASTPTANPDAEVLLQREAVPVAASVPATAADKNLPKAVESWQLNVLVVDGEGEPLHGAEVIVTPSPVEAPASQVASLPAEPTATLITDAKGRAAMAVAVVEARVMASLGGVVSQPVTARQGRREWRLVVQPPVLLRGRVLRSDGLPWMGAEVCGHTNGVIGFLEAGSVPQPVAARCDADGRFEISLVRHGQYVVWAEGEGRRSFDRDVTVHLPMLPELVLVEPGAHSIRGLVVDAEGKPVANADVLAWAKNHEPVAGAVFRVFRGDDECPAVRADEAGRFEIHVQKFGDYCVMATAKGRCSSIVESLAVTPEWPHATLDLVLPHFATITGVVQRPDRTPCSGIKVTAQPVGDLARIPGAASLERHFGSASATTQSDGRFTLHVHPGTEWVVVVWPVKNETEFTLQRIGIVPGRQDLSFTIDPAQLTRCVVRVQLQTPFDAAALGGCQFRVVRADAAGRPRSGASGSSDGNAFELPPLPIGIDYFLEITPRPVKFDRFLHPDLAPAVHGPFRTAGESMQLVIPLPRLGQMKVTVLRADGSPARGTYGLVWREPHIGTWGTSATPVDPDGVFRESWCVPGSNKVKIFDDSGLLLELDVTIVPGLNPDLTVTLPAITTPR